MEDVVGEICSDGGGKGIGSNDDDDDEEDDDHNNINSSPRNVDFFSTWSVRQWIGSSEAGCHCAAIDDGVACHYSIVRDCLSLERMKDDSVDCMLQMRTILFDLSRFVENQMSMSTQFYTRCAII